MINNVHLRTHFACWIKNVPANRQALPVAWCSSHLLLLLLNIYFPEREAIQLNISSPASAASPPFSMRSALHSLSELIACQFASNFLFFSLFVVRRLDFEPKKRVSAQNIIHSGNWIGRRFFWPWKMKMLLPWELLILLSLKECLAGETPSWSPFMTHTWYACFCIKRAFFNCGTIYSTCGLLQYWLLLIFKRSKSHFPIFTVASGCSRTAPFILVKALSANTMCILVSDDKQVIVRFTFQERILMFLWVLILWCNLLDIYWLQHITWNVEPTIKIHPLLFTLIQSTFSFLFHYRVFETLSELREVQINISLAQMCLKISSFYLLIL